MRVTRPKVMSTMWAGGRPSNDRRYADVYFAARSAGLDDGQSMSLACAAYDASNGFVERLSSSTRSLRRATLERKAADPTCPWSLWAYMKAKLQGHYRYISDEEIRETSMNDHAGWTAWAQKAEAQSIEANR